jgi:HSP20 family protein
MRIATDPTRELSLLQGDVNRVFERFFGPQGAVAGEARWAPALDIVEEDDRFLLHLDLPGMADDDIELEIEDRVLRISGERRNTLVGSDSGFRRTERAFGRFERTLTLPRGIDADAVAASFDRGVLEITIPKPEQVRPRRIAVNGGAGAQPEIEGAASEDRELAKS